MATAVAAGVVIAKIADAALSACCKSKPYIDDFCAGFCAEILEGISALEVSIMFESTTATQMRAKTDEWRNEFGWTKRKREFAKPMDDCA